MDEVKKSQASWQVPMSELYQVLQPEFERLIFQNAQLDLLWTGGRWCEGPAWLPAGKYALWSDIPNNRTLRWDETDGSVSEFENPARNQNGHTVDRFGRLISCEHQGRCVSRIEFDGSRTILADSYEGKRLNSPNDVVVKSDNSIWFTDPTYGIDSDYEGDAANSEIGSSNVYKIAANGKLTCEISDLKQPNGLAFSIGEHELYVADTGKTHDPNCDANIYGYQIDQKQAVIPSSKRLLTRCDNGLYDGFRIDTSGNIWTSAGDGVHCVSAAGKLLGKIFVPETVANLCFIGSKKNRLFICATTSVYAIYVNASGAH
ncbi:gluconolactonase [Maritalea porphyrae]|uniref:Gluconolactonase n=1 Tax=Maritalea porphyrae TaxID=880732 RepID=A0ABQ5UUD2_9HYPH|nr:gluconolactonase [Maritalea porphyrae]